MEAPFEKCFCGNPGRVAEDATELRKEPQIISVFSSGVGVATDRDGECAAEIAENTEGTTASVPLRVL
jgi:hypothetical protein